MAFTNNQNLANSNAPQSPYATAFGYNQNKVLLNDIKKEIVDRMPEDFRDIQMLMMKTPKMIKSDERIWFELNTSIQPLRSQPLPSNIAAGTTQVIPVLDTTVVGLDTNVGYPTNQKATVIAIDPAGSTVTLQSQTGVALPALSSGQSYVFNFQSTGVADGAAGGSSNYRLNPLIEQYNWLELFYAQTNMGLVDKLKYQNNEAVNYLFTQLDKMHLEVYTGMSNAFWNGTRGQYTMSNGTPAKAMEGVYPWMVRNGSYAATTTTANLWDTLQTAAFATRTGTGNYPRMIFAAPKYIQAISDNLKTTLIRYTAEGDNDVSLNLNTVSLGTGQFVLQPYQRFEQASGSFPSFFEDTVFMLDWNLIDVAKMEGLPDMTGTIGAIGDNPYTTALNSTNYMLTSLTTELKNPYGHAIISVNG